ncbi:MAG: Mutator MutT protein (7,8-dihydro-8-oxoguanine-triphosphatase) [Candidatus Bipolaricaulis sibiricus]|uniref:Oxidized purine nucleoside triphosphate hydrolase n=1 Tax=Bipolaricaulis sibiricus TaxID=2501609 RepID=A0A410FSN7_BIPS1|nr:MAG: Mutator MutT protein (7,8-dihydro-8-oxoguanine-triphosphatase) [Candidatus Bipolaricaulis sibiricus]
MKVHGIDWRAWVPEREATLLFVIRDGRVLLIHKKRGLGAGKVNGPGGHLQDGESTLAAAVREVEEELGVTPLDVEPCGELRFQFTDGLALLVHVFRASDLRGEPRESDEATPFWVPLDAIPFERMWADDRIWFPWMLRGVPFAGRFTFDGDTLLDFDLRPLSHTAKGAPRSRSGGHYRGPNRA